MLDAPLVIKSANYILDLQKGSNLLSGMDALLFVRHRSSYPNADIGRINAQEMFVSALLEKINSFDLCHYYKIFDALSETLITDNARVATASLISLAFNARDFKMTHYILPGVSEVIDGVWYYRINSSEARVILEKLFNNSLLNKALLG
jgi:anionic cell wall polymer biosynthesis LytR-Cps2A-Psr (LCP) family protein